MQHDFQLTSNGYGVYHGTSSFPVKIKDHVERRYVHRFQIWERPITVVTLFANPYREHLWYFLEHAKKGTFSTIPNDIFCKELLERMVIPTDHKDVWFTSRAYTVAKHISYNKFNVEDSELKRIMDYGKKNDLLTVPIMFNFDDLFETWI
jgi:hypothetical protein